MVKPAKREASAVAAGHEPAFREIIGLIAAARRRAFQAEMRRWCHLSPTGRWKILSLFKESTEANNFSRV